MHTKHCLLRTYVRVHSLTWLAAPARPYYARSCLLRDYSSSTLVSTTLACPVVWSWVGNITWRCGLSRTCSGQLSPPFAQKFFYSLGGVLVVNQVTRSFRTVMASDITALTELLKQQMEASAQREKRMAETLDQSLKTVTLAPQPALAATQAGASQ